MNKFSLLSFLKFHLKDTLLAMISIMLESALEISIPFLMNLLLKNGLNETVINNVYTYSLNLDYLFLIGGIMILFALLALLLGLSTAYFTANAGRYLGEELRKAEYQKILSYSFANLDSFRINSLITRITGDIQIISDAFCQSLRPLLRSPVQLIFALSFAIIMSKDLSIVFAIILPLMTILLFFMAIRAKPRFIKVQRALDKINLTTEESLVAIRFIRANAKEDYENEKFESVNSENKKIATKATSFIAFNSAIMQGMTYTCILGILIVGTNISLTNHDANMIINMGSFLSYVSQLLASLNMISNVFMTFSRSEASKERIKEVFEQTSEIEDRGKEKLSDSSIVFKNVSFIYPNHSEKVLDDISFTISSGSFIGIIGETGSGKTSLVNLISRYYEKTEGDIFIGNKKIEEYSLNSLHSNIATAFQIPQLFKGTILDNLKYGNENIDVEDVILASKIAECYPFIMDMKDNFNSLVSSRGTSLSGGQKQRIALARALLKKPKILILDDSFSALDRITERKIKDNLKKYLSDTTIIVISQKISTIEDAEMIIVLDKGKVSSIGTSKELLEQDGIYKSIYTLQRKEDYGSITK